MRPQQLPADTHAFVNRTDELGRLGAVLTDRAGDPVLVSVYVIAGTAGAGKTSLALRWAHQVKDQFPDGQLYANLRGYDPGEPVAPSETLHRFLIALGVSTTAVPRDIDAASALYRSLLADRRILILLDNAATVSQVRPLLPGSGSSLVVVTSRSRLSGLAVRDGARRLTLGTLPEAEAVALLRAVTSGYRPADDAGKLTELAGLCARLPLALRIAAERAASHPHMRLDDLIADLRDESALWDALSTGDPEEADAVRTVFAWSYRALSEQTARVFRLLGLHPGPEFSLHAAAALAGLPVARARQLLDDLVGAHLVEQPAPDRYQFHDLLRAYATDQAQHEESADARSAALRRVLEWYLHTADAAQKQIAPAEPRVLLDTAAPEVRPSAFSDYDEAMDWSEREHANFLPVVRSAAAAGHHRLAWQLSTVLGHVMPSSFPVAAWLLIGELGLSSAERLGDRTAQIQLLTQRGMEYRNADRLDESLDCHRKALAIARESGARTDEADSLNLIGLIDLRRRHLGSAARHFEESIALFREEGSTHWEATARANLASTLFHSGQLPEADDAIRRAMSAHRSLRNERGEGNLLRLAAELHCERGEASQALRSARDALEIALRLRNQRLEGFWLITLGNAHLANEEPDEALASYQRSATLHRRLGNPGREALAWHGAGTTYRQLHRHAESADFHRRAATVHRELGDSWNEALALEGLGLALCPEEPQTAHRHWTEALGRIADYQDLRALGVRTRLEARLAAAG
ncbi:tetratricopeptide repeat protein [Streptomyces sp. NPDC006649]|uniref:ATP-binding protein n=1 Tax=Streptomyces sp. NPDC006649 TaxID=3156896 RepID=UPI0033AAFE74